MFFFFLMIRRPPRSTLDRSSAASDVYKRQDRDRPVPDRRAARNLERQEAVGVRGGGAVGVELVRELHDAFEAVSYTHLRAHETVLDLVCRLLLEKKKKRNTVKTTPLSANKAYRR